MAERTSYYAGIYVGPVTVSYYILLYVIIHYYLILYIIIYYSIYLDQVNCTDQPRHGPERAWTMTNHCRNQVLYAQDRDVPRILSNSCCVSTGSVPKPASTGCSAPGTEEGGWVTGLDAICLARSYKRLGLVLVSVGSCVVWWSWSNIGGSNLIEKILLLSPYPFDPFDNDCSSIRCICLSSLA